MKEILLRLQQAGRKAFVVGGAVRDLYLGLKPKDFDLVSEASPEEIEALFPKTIGVGRQFGIMVVVTEAGPVEIARFRTDGAYTDGRHPNEVEFTNPEEDAKRRDFTINALFYDPAAGQVIDYVDGKADLDARLIRCVGEPARRFEEDALRMLRAVRFLSQLPDFRIHADIVAAIQHQADRLALVSRERITQEMDKIFLSPKPSVGLEAIVQTNLWEPIFGTPSVSHEILRRFDHLEAIYFRSLHEHAPLRTYYAAVSQWFPGTAFVLSKETKTVLASLPKLRASLLNFSQLEMADQKMALDHPSFNDAWAILSTENETPDWVLRLPAQKQSWMQRGTLNPPALLRGEDLVALGIPAGPKIREFLERVRRAQLNEKISTREEALALVTA